MNNFGEFLYELRKEKGMTQAELAAALGVTNKAVSKWETGEAMPETSQLLPLSRIFGVTVDELLDGKRADVQSENIKYENDELRSDSDEIDAFFSERMKRHIFARGREMDEERTLSDKIGGVICAAIFFAGLITYLFLGSLADLWSPWWVLIPVSALLCGIVGSIFDLINPKKRNKKIARGENPYVGTVCGIVMLLCIITYLLLGAFANLWHPYWIVIVCGAVFSAVFGAVGNVMGHKKK